MLREQAGFNDLPIEVLFEIYSYLSPEQAAVVASVNNVSDSIIQNSLNQNKNIQGNLFWEKKYERHFPHLYNGLRSQRNINWYAAFRETYAEEYKNLSTDDRRLFSLVKESDVESLRAKKIALDSFDKKDINGKSLLDWAQQAGNQKVLDYFYETALTSYITENQHVIDVSKTDEYGRTILYWALACYQDYEQIDLLLLQGSKFDEKYFRMQFQPIHIAAQEGRLDVVQGLIENKPELLNQVDAHGQTPLMWAASKGHLAVVVYLLAQHGVNLNAASQGFNGANRNWNGKTALHWAADHGHGEVVTAFIKAGATATVTTVGVMQSQPIHIAAQEGRLNVVQTLIENKPELLNQVDAYGQTPLMWAASKGHLPVVVYLLAQHGVNLNAASQGFNGANRYGNGKTAIHWAADHGHNEVVDTLLKHGMTLTLAMPIDKSKLNEKVKAEVELLEYIPKRSSESKYKTSFTLFCRTFNFGFSKQEKLDAANALKNVVINGADKSILDLYKEELSNGDLGSIYRAIGV